MVVTGTRFSASDATAKVLFVREICVYLISGENRAEDLGVRLQRPVQGRFRNLLKRVVGEGIPTLQLYRMYRRTTAEAESAKAA